MARLAPPVRPTPTPKPVPPASAPRASSPATASCPIASTLRTSATATAPAQIVGVSDQLDANLDWSTFEFTEIGFGDFLIPVPSGSQHFETIVPMSYNGVAFEVWIYADLNAATGKVQVDFYSIDPLTWLPPNVLIGFLPPEDGTGIGMGHVSYTVRPKPGLATGTQVRNVADIQFDQGTVIATNQRDPHDPSKGSDPAKECLNTIDSGAPTSAVNPLPATVATRSFTVSWSGQDNAGGSGVAGYDIAVSEDGGPTRWWLYGTKETSATFTGEDGHTYAFYSIALDNVGNAETGPADPDAVTQIKVPPPFVPNVAPSFVKGPNQTVLENAGAQTINGWATSISAGPPSEAGQALDFIVTNSNNGLFASQPAVDASGTLTFTPAAHVNGSATVTIRLHDSGGTVDGGVDTSAPQIFLITVTPGNRGLNTIFIPLILHTFIQ